MNWIYILACIYVSSQFLLLKVSCEVLVNKHLAHNLQYTITTVYSVYIAFRLLWFSLGSLIEAELLESEVK